MAKQIHHLKGFSIVTPNMKVHVPLNVTNERLNRAQYWLDTQVMEDMVPYMPHRTGTFIAVTKAQSNALAGTGNVMAAAPPAGRFLYMGKVMVDPETGSPWARKGAKKVVTDRPLTYSNPEARPEWFEVAKEKNLSRWVKGVKDILGGRK